MWSEKSCGSCSLLTKQKVCGLKWLSQIDAPEGSARCSTQGCASLTNAASHHISLARKRERATLFRWRKVIDASPPWFAPPYLRLQAEHCSLSACDRHIGALESLFNHPLLFAPNGSEWETIDRPHGIVRSSRAHRPPNIEPFAWKITFVCRSVFCSSLSLVCLCPSCSAISMHNLFFARRLGAIAFYLLADGQSFVHQMKWILRPHLARGIARFESDLICNFYHLQWHGFPLHFAFQKHLIIALHISAINIFQQTLSSTQLWSQCNIFCCIFKRPQYLIQHGNSAALF